jgi:hypothetical protein
MAAGLGFKDFTTGEVLTAADVDGYLMQGIWVFASTAARDASVTSPSEGNFAFTKDTNSLWYYDGAAWVASGATGDIEGVTAGIGISGGGTSGTVTVTNSMATAIDAKGDLVVGTGADTFSKLTVGANGTTLVADSSTATGLKWDTASSGSMTLLQTVTLSGASVTSSSFSGSSYKRIFMHIHKGVNSSLAELRMRLNADTGSNYSLQGGSSEGSTNYAAGTPNSTFVTLSFIGTTTTLNLITSGIATIDNPSNTDTVFINSEAIGYDGSLLRQLKYSGIYKGSAAITSITFFPDNGTFTSGSISIYGVN